jgi:ABC-type glycerol-3-phosphate transport system substrate-binding protein
VNGVGEKAPPNIVFLDGYGILAKSEHPEAAFEWIRFLMEHDAASGRQIPPLKTLIDSQRYAARVSKPTLTVAKSLESGILPFSLENMRDNRFGEMFNIYSDAVIQVMERKANARQALEEAQLKADQIYK